MIGTDAEIMARPDVDQIRPFDWATEFEDVIGDGGFDVVIGNPPCDVLEKERGGVSGHTSAKLAGVR